MNKEHEYTSNNASQAVRLNAALVSLHSELFDANMNLKPNFFQSTACPVCGSDASREYCIKDHFRYQICNACGMVYMNPRLNTEATLAFYNSQANEIYNEDKFHTVSASTSMDDKINFENLQLIVKHIDEKGQEGSLKGNRVLEIGCAKGYFLNRAKEFGAEVVGVELNQGNFEMAKRLLGDNVYDRDLIELNLPGESFDVIYTRDVIEHIHDPMPFLKEVYRLMKPGAMVFFETHNIDGLIHRIVRGKHTCIFGFEHPVHWSPKSLSLAFRKSGLMTQNIYFDSLDFRILDIIQYYRCSTWTTIFPWKASKPLEILLKIVSIPFRVPGIRKIDQFLLPRLANYLNAGSTMKVIAIKPHAAVENAL